MFVFETRLCICLVVKKKNPRFVNLKLKFVFEFIGLKLCFLRIVCEFEIVLTKQFIGRMPNQTLFLNRILKWPNRFLFLNCTGGNGK